LELTQAEDRAAIAQIRKDGEDLIAYAFLINQKGKRLLKMAEAFEKQLVQQETAKSG
jgi:hypothetical protein